ncbi:hypothetical protein [Gloeobacter morelensis]|uniref:hypothetical protein n=1 Tax=Gloeobacter morelensis TaxID=2907343 RepID=UPI001E5274E0|nr:hypothetical protein [Gloeobacter morelensis]UFP97194.1 hypothetical protein ISF26_24035 [Gloeobacter morelensis MG652769]
MARFLFEHNGALTIAHFVCVVSAVYFLRTDDFTAAMIHLAGAAAFLPVWPAESILTLVIRLLMSICILFTVLT